MDNYNSKKIRIVISRSFFFKKMIFFILIKEHNMSKQTSGVIGPIGFLNNFEILQLVFDLKAYSRLDF